MWPPPLPADFLIQIFWNKSQDHNLALGRNRAEQFVFEYWSPSRLKK